MRFTRTLSAIKCEAHCMARRYFLFLSLRGSLQTNRSWPGKEKGIAVPVGVGWGTAVPELLSLVGQE